MDPFLLLCPLGFVVVAGLFEGGQRLLSELANGSPRRQGEDDDAGGGSQKITRIIRSNLKTSALPKKGVGWLTPKKRSNFLNPPSNCPLTKLASPPGKQFLLYFPSSIPFSFVPRRSSISALVASATRIGTYSTAAVVSAKNTWPHCFPRLSFF